MSDRPLFQNTDQQEAAYDPQGRAARQEEGDGADPVLPAGFGPITTGNTVGNVGTVGGAGGTGPAPAVGSAVGATALHELAADDGREERSNDH